MFNPITPQLLNEQLINYNWQDNIIRLQSSYIFKTNILKILSCDLATQFQHFGKLCLKNIVAKLYKGQQIGINGLWQNEVCQISVEIKKLYCQIMRRLKRKKKVDIMDIVILVISLLSREFLQTVFVYSKKQPTKSQNGIRQIFSANKANYNKTNYNKTKTNDPQNNLSVQQYSFIIIIFQTTGNKVSQQTFQFLKSKIISKTIFKPNNSLHHLQTSLKYVKQNISRKHIQLHKRQKNQKNIDKNIFKSTLKIFSSTDHQLKIQPKKDALSYSLYQFLNENQQIELLAKGRFPKNLQNPFERQQKIHQRNLSKAVKFNYGLEQKDWSLLERNKDRAQSMKTSSKNYWKQVKSISKPVFQIIPKQNQVIIKQVKEEKKKNWVTLIAKLKSDSNREYVVEKFKAKSVSVNLQNESQRDKQTKQTGSPIRLSIPFQPQQSKLSNLSEITNIQKKWIKSSITDTGHKIKRFENIIESKLYINQQNLIEEIETDFHKIKKKVIDIKKCKKDFEQKCRKRKDKLQNC